MNKALRVPDYLIHILQAIERVERYTLGLNEAQFTANEMIQDAVIRNFEVIGEAANNIQRADATFAAAHSEIPWQVMYTMRNRLTHGYDKIDLAIVWQSIRKDLPALHALVKTALD
jgi:uncharacterized protein with HEPN domain